MSDDPRSRFCRHLNDHGLAVNQRKSGNACNEKNIVRSARKTADGYLTVNELKVFNNIS